MNVIVNAKNTTLTDAIKDYSEKKVGRLEKYFDSPMDIQVNLDIEKNLHVVEILVNVKGLFLKGIEKSEDMYASIDLAVDKIERQLVKYKEKIRKHKYNELKQEDSFKLNIYNYDEEKAADELEVIVSKFIPAKPMDIEEAVMQMDLLNKNFFVFRNSENLDINVVYKRDDGKIGLIEQ